MQTIPNVTTADTYTAGCTLEDLNAVAATYVAANAAVIAQFRPKRKDGTQAPWGPELLLSPQSNSMVNVAAMRFRSAVAGVPAQIVAALYDETDALPGAATPFSQTISSSGSVTPGLNSVQIQKDGTLIGAEPILDFVTGTGVVVTAADDPANTRVTVSLAAAAAAVTLIGVDELSANATRDLSVAVPANTYRSLGVRYSLRRNGLGVQEQAMYFNGETPDGNYGGIDWRADSSPSSSVLAVANMIPVGFTTGTDSRANCWLVGEATIVDPNSTSKIKQAWANGMFSDATVYYRFAHAGVFAAAPAAISAVALAAPSGGWLSGSKMAVYGYA